MSGWHWCSSCSRGFSQLHNLQRHIREQHGSAGLLCDGCGVLFRRPAHLALHACRHRVGIRCAHCPSHVEPTRRQLIAHVRQCHVQQSTTCPVCGRVFEDYWRMAAHRQRHGVARHECQRCRHMFHSAGALSSHMMCAHDHQRDTTNNPTHNAQYNPTHDSQHNPTHDLIHSPTHDTISNPTTVTTQNITHDRLHSPAHDIQHHSTHVTQHNPTHDLMPNTRLGPDNISILDIMTGPAHSTVSSSKRDTALGSQHDTHNPTYDTEHSADVSTNQTLTPTRATWSDTVSDRDPDGDDDSAAVGSLSATLDMMETVSADPSQTQLVDCECTLELPVSIDLLQVGDQLQRLLGHKLRVQYLQQPDSSAQQEHVMVVTLTDDLELGDLM